MIKSRKFRRRKKQLSTDEEIDPMIYSVNMVDCMLVLAVGFLIFTIIFMHANPQEMNQTELKLGEQLNITPQTSSGSGNGYTQVGTVYKDPETGELIMVQNGQ